MDMTHSFRTPCPVGQNYAEASYFDGYHFQHIAAYLDSRRLKRLRREAARAVDRRRNGRARP